MTKLDAPNLDYPNTCRSCTNWNYYAHECRKYNNYQEDAVCSDYNWC